MDPEIAQTSIFVSLAMNVFTDMIFSLLSLSLLVDGRPTYEKVAICSIISIGLMATCDSIYKTTTPVENFDVNAMSSHFN